jgi:hypothetical protein
MAEKLIKCIDIGGIDKFYPAPAVMQAVTTAGTGSAYTVTIPGITALTAGLSILVKPHTTSTTRIPTINVNGLGAKEIGRRLSIGDSNSYGGEYANTFYSGRPMRLTYDGTEWLADDYPKPSAIDINGIIGIDKGGTGATTKKLALTNLGITYGPTDLTAGTSELAEGTFYFVYE